jgi:mannosyltransferase OCH1-like enzyme
LWTLEDVYSGLQSIDVIAGLRTFEIIEAIRVCRIPSMQADLIRLVLLYEFGGIWIDLKLVPLKTFLQNIIENELVLVEHHKTKEYPEPWRFNLLINGFFGCEPRSLFIEEVLKLAVNNVKNRKHGVWDVTGPRVFMTVLDKLYPNSFQRTYPGFLLIRNFQFFDVNVGWGWSTYNKNGLHWSERMKREPIYRD